MPNRRNRQRSRNQQNNENQQGDRANYEIEPNMDREAEERWRRRTFFRRAEEKREKERQRGLAFTASVALSSGIMLATVMAHLNIETEQSDLYVGLFLAVFVWVVYFVFRIQGHY